LEEWSENEAATRASKELEELLRARRARAVELERLARDLDPTVSSRSRAVLFAALAIVGLALAVSGIVARREVTPRGIFFESLGPDAIVFVGIVVLRKQLLNTTLNRRVAFSLFATVVAITASRAVGMLAGMTAAQTLTHDLLMLAALAVIGSLLLFRWIAWCAPILLVGAVFAATLHDHAIRVFSIAAGAAQLVILAFAWRRAGQETSK